MDKNSVNSTIDNDDEINLSDLLKKIAVGVHKRYTHTKLALIAMISVILIATVVSMLINPPKLNYSTVVSFSFTQAQKGTYPNGSPFTINNIISRTVLEQVWQANDLQAENISLNDFVNSVSISQYFESEQFIRSRYESMLTKKGLTQTEISTIERDFRAEIDAGFQRQALLTLTVPFDSPMSGQKARKLILDILKTWSYQAVNVEGVLSIPSADIENINEALIQRATPFKVIDYLYKTINNINATLRKIQSFPGGETLRDPQTGRSIQEIQRSVQELDRYWVVDLDNYVRTSIVPTALDLKSAQERLTALEISRELLLREAQTYRQSLVDYDAMRQQEQINLGSENNKSANGGLQLQGDSIQRLINLGSQNKDAEFRQDLTQKRVAAELKASQMEQEITRLKRRMLVVSNQTATPTGRDDQFNTQVLEITDQIKLISASLARIETLQMQKFLNNEGLLYVNSAILSRPASSLVRYLALPIALTGCLFILLVFLGLLNRYGVRLSRLAIQDVSWVKVNS